MNIIKRSGRSVKFNANKITKRIKEQAEGLSVDVDSVAIKVISEVHDNITTKELDIFAAETAAMKTIDHPDYSNLASKIAITSLWKDTPDTFYKAVCKLASKTDLLGGRFINFVQDNQEALNDAIVHERDFRHDYFGFKTLERSYLLRDGNRNIIERPQYMWMRTAIMVSKFDLRFAIKTYNLMSQGYYTHATPTLFNSGTKRPQLSSCFLLANKEDSIAGIYETLSDCAKISQWAGGIGLHIHDVRAKGSYIKGTGGTSNGITPMLRVFNETARYVDQGGGKRKGSFAVYLEPWHADIEDFLELKKNHGKEEMRARDLFYAMWVPDLFMEQVEKDGDWHLFCPNEVYKATGEKLSEVYGEKFKILYNHCVSLGIHRKSIKARDLFKRIVTSQIETGTPYMLYKDQCNDKSNQKNLGTIKSSNLCAEIVEYSSKNEQAVCNLASIALPRFVNGQYFDFMELEKVAYHATFALNNVIDVNYYPTSETRTSNDQHRPIGLGVQGLADVFIKLGYAFDSKEAKRLNKVIFETIYMGSMRASIELARPQGKYESYKGSPLSEGKFQFDLYKDFDHSDLSRSKGEWDILRYNLNKYGSRNSLNIALMPTASTGQILGNTECFEPISSNLYTRRTLAGEFPVVNKYLIHDLIELGLWDEKMKYKIIQEKGSVMNIPEIPTDLKEKYKTAYEISQKVIIDLAADRQPFVCQSQSMNIFMSNPNVAKVSAMHIYGWKKGLKTGMYYLRSKAAVDAIQFTVKKDNVEPPACSIDDPDCESCGA
jgi:ribonucleoside-diphosphate reductase alpha chain